MIPIKAEERISKIRTRVREERAAIGDLDSKVIRDALAHPRETAEPLPAQTNK